MEVKETIKTQFGISQLNTNFNSTIKLFNDLVKENNWVVKLNNENVDELKLKGIFSIGSSNNKINHKIDWNLSLNSRKALAKRMYYFNVKKTVKTANMLFSIFKKLDVINDNVKVDVSTKEQEIVRKRKAYKDLMKQTEVARLAYKAEKGDFYKKRMIKLGY